ncbi:MAG: HAD family hydrolase [Pseudomonadota bacterium]
MLFSLIAVSRVSAQALPSWQQDTSSLGAITRFVERVVDPKSPDYVEPAARIAVFDNDGTLWAEQPVYFQLLFAMDRVRAMASDNPEWKTTEPFKSVLAGDSASVLAGGEAAILEVVTATHAGMTTDTFDQSVITWLDSARHPSTGRPFTEMVYQPMLELLDYLRAKGFTTYIVSGGGIDYMRPWTERVYGIPPQQVVGSQMTTRYRLIDGEPRLWREPELRFIDDKAGKPVGIHTHIGRRPILAVGNSDGDFEMLEWTTAGQGPRLGVLIHHTDAEREWAYDRQSHIGQLRRGLDEGPERGWVIVNMKTDWTRIFPPSP